MPERFKGDRASHDERYTNPFNIRSKGQRSRSQGHKVQKHISGDRVASVSLHSIEWPASSLELGFDSSSLNTIEELVPYAVSSFRYRFQLLVFQVEVFSVR